MLGVDSADAPRCQLGFFDGSSVVEAHGGASGHSGPLGKRLHTIPRTTIFRGSPHA